MTDDQSNITLSSDQRQNWNDYVSHVSSLGGDPTNAAYIKGFSKDNPDSTLTADHIPVAINEVQQLKQGNPVGKMTQDQAQTIQSGMTANYKANPSNLNYPVSPTHGTDLEGHADANTGGGGKNPNTIPKPDYNDPASRLKYAAAFRAKYGDTVAGFGDTPLRVNETPENGIDTAKNASIKAASKLGIDPKLLYSSSMVEGMSGLYADKKGMVDFSDNDKFPVNGFHNFGLDTFSDQAKGLIKKGYLPPDFASQYAPKQRTNEKGELVNSADFKTPDAALQATAAVIKDSQDQAEAYAKKNNISLSDKQKEFFALTAYNAGSGNMQKIMQNYSKAGALKDDGFIEKRPNDTYKTIHENVKSRMVLRDALDKEGLF